MRNWLFGLLLIFVSLIFSADAQTCALSINTSTTGVLFGLVDMEGTSAVNSTRVMNTGEATADLSISGVDWSDGTHTMPVGQTRWSSSWSDYDSATALTNALAQVTPLLGAGSFQEVFLAVRVPAGQYASTYSQTITFTLEC
ncbi:hypothetical protein HY991_04805 [Candidatus Micrarchaeota archaeon]|nr:hypothetical protein [Candidatus Micrarchaeota archaeon]